MILLFRNKLLISLASILMLVGCSYKETNIQSRDIGYLKFNKHESANYLVVINDKFEIKLSKCITDDSTGICFDDSKNKLYEVTSGNLNIKVYDNKKNLIINKNVYLGSTSTMEVNF